MDDIPCVHLLAEQGKVCGIGRKPPADCIGCGAYDWHSEPTGQHWDVWREIRIGHHTTSSVGAANPGWRAGP